MQRPARILEQKPTTRKLRVHETLPGINTTRQIPSIFQSAPAGRPARGRAPVCGPVGRQGWKIE